MTKFDTIVMGLIIAMLISITHFSLTMGTIYGTLMVLINLIDSKGRRTYESKRSFEKRESDC
ncbi:hypothetical protein IGJ38_001205 [Enterococcus pernyi]